MHRDLDFIYVGAPKAGSTWLFEALRGHPAAYILPSKSSGFFETENPRPLDCYRALIDKAPAGVKVGEIAHDAYVYSATASRLRAAFPGVRVLVCLREPGDFAESTLRWWSTHTRRFGSEVEEMTRHPHFRRHMDYQACLAPFFAEFPADQIKILFFDDLLADPRQFHSEVCQFIGLAPTIERANLTGVVNGSHRARMPALTRSAYALGGIARRLGLGKLVERAKHAPVVESLLYSGAPSPANRAIIEASDRERALARENFA